MKHKIYFSMSSRGLLSLRIKSWIKQAVFTALKAEGVGAACEVSVLITDDEGIRELNHDFRKLNRPTDVLSFPANEMTAGEFNPDSMETSPKTGRIVLGDMALSLERAEAQGREFGHGLKREVQYLTVHSVLHLLGYDHVDEGAMKLTMRAREKDIMAEIEGVREK